MKHNLKKAMYWVFAVSIFGLLLAQVVHSLPMAIALTGLFAAVLGTVFFGEERMPFVLLGIVLLLVGGVDTFHHFVENMEWILFVKLAALLTWVDYLSHTKYFDDLLEKYLPRNLKGYTLMATLFVLAGVSAALIDEVNSIVLWYAVIRAIIGFTKRGHFKLKTASWTVLTILVVSATNIGSQFLPLGNPVGIAVSVLSGLNAMDFIRYAWVPGLVTLAYFVIRVRFTFGKLISEFQTVTVEQKDFDVLREMEPQYEMREIVDPVQNIDTHEVHSSRPSFRVLNALFISGVLGLILAGPVATLFGISQETGIGIFVLALFAVTLFLASSHGRHNEIMLSELPWSTLFFIVFLFGIAHGLEKTGLTELVAQEIIGGVGQNAVLVRLIIVVIGAIVTAFMDNVIAIAILAPIIVSLGKYGFETNGLWFSLLSVSVVAGNLTPIGSAANIIANARVRSSWGTWWRVAGILAIECLIVNQVVLYLWEMVI